MRTVFVHKSKVVARIFRVGYVFITVFFNKLIPVFVYDMRAERSWSGDVECDDYNSVDRGYYPQSQQISDSSNRRCYEGIVDSDQSKNIQKFR